MSTDAPTFFDRVQRVARWGLLFVLVGLLALRFLAPASLPDVGDEGYAAARSQELEGEWLVVGDRGLLPAGVRLTFAAGSLSLVEDGTSAGPVPFEVRGVDEDRFFLIVHHERPAVAYLERDGADRLTWVADRGVALRRLTGPGQ